MVAIGNDLAFLTRGSKYTKPAFGPPSPVPGFFLIVENCAPAGSVFTIDMMQLAVDVGCGVGYVGNGRKYRHGR
jgi:hypothetical protein